jgi:gliding motility-associated-like protein
MLGSNSPLCAGDTLFLTAADPITTLTYSWTGPNGFTSDEKDPFIPNVPLADSGLYSLTITYRNCNSSASEFVHIYPPVVLTDVSLDQEMPYGGYVQLYASGALYYVWSPSNGTLSDYNIYNPIASPEDSTTYSVIGMNEWGCRDTAYVTITIDYNVNTTVPSAFTPNGDGRNDIFRLVYPKFIKMLDFSIFDRWGKLVYHNTTDITQGWDGRYNGVDQDMGVYFYSIIVATPDGKMRTLKGDVTLLR